MSSKRLDLGFVEKTSNNWLLNSNFFPSKVGGKPAWLDLSELPKITDLQCGKCDKTLIFLCQIYSPVEDNDDCFHRTIFLFVCRDEKCCVRNESPNFLALRSQIKRNNPFYSFEPPNENKESEWKIENFTTICNLCGLFADKHCSKCKIASYCCREHQIIDWKKSHKKSCGRVGFNEENDYLFEEFEIVIEEEVVKEEEVIDEEEVIREEEDINEEIKNEEVTNEKVTKKKEETEEEAEKRRLEEFKELEIKGELGTMQDCADLEEHVSEIEEDKTFTKFREKIGENPEQILRYQRGAEPLWIANEPKPHTIPNCENCGAERQFEFQILPQLLYHLHEDNLDWGILCIYTCEKNCSSAKPYKKEFIFKQDVALTNI